MIVVVVPIKDGKFLMVHNPKRGWEFPGGKIEMGEDPHKAALRECYEEAGIMFKNLKFVKREKDIFLFVGEIEEIKGGEMEWQLFSNLPNNLAFSREEAIRFLELTNKMGKFF